MALRNADGDVYLDGIITGKTGSAVDTLVVGGTIGNIFATVGNTAGAGFTNLATYSVPAAALSTNNQSFWFESCVQMAAFAGNAVLQVTFGPTTLFNYTLVNPVAAYINLYGRIFRTGAATQIGVCSMVIGPLSYFYMDTDVVGLAATLANANNLIVQGQCTTANVLSALTLLVGFDGANS